jgi:hypothetical protein
MKKPKKAVGLPRTWFNSKLAASLVDHTLLVGISEYEHDGTFIRRRQMFGRVSTADRHRGICLELGSEAFWLPPDTRSILRAEPGVYQNLSTGEVVENPDFTATWSVRKAPPVAPPDAGAAGPARSPGSQKRRVAPQGRKQPSRPRLAGVAKAAPAKRRASRTPRRITMK